MTTSSDRSRANQETFNQAAAGYFSAPLSFFEVLGERLVDAVRISTGQSVLDVGCGTGASTLPAGRRVGPTGGVMGVDISAAMLDIARRRSREEGHHWVDYKQADIALLRLEERFDVGICGFTTQMFDDLMTVPRTLARHLKDGGRIGLSVWAKGSWEPHTTVFRRVISEVRPDLLPKPGNTQKLQEPGVIETMMGAAGFADPSIEAVQLAHVLNGFDEYWQLVTFGSRGVTGKLSVDELSELRAKLQKAIAPECDSKDRLTLSMASIFVLGQLR